MPTAASMRKPAPANVPIAPLHHNVAAVFMPRTLKPSRKITPPPKKPRPLTTWAAIRVGLDSWSMSKESETNIAVITRRGTLWFKKSGHRGDFLAGRLWAACLFSNDSCQYPSQLFRKNCKCHADRDAATIVL